MLRPRRTLERLMADPFRLRFGMRALGLTAFLYTLVYLFLIVGGGRPTVFRPWLAIDPEHYYRYNVFFLAPSMFAGVLVAAAVTQLAARRLGGRGSFEDMVTVLGVGTSIASWWTLVHDLS